MKVYSSILIVFSLLCLTHRMVGQELEESLYVTSKVMPGKVVLRWAPVNPDIWKKAISQGYYVLRATLPSDKKGLENYRYDTLSSGILPLPFDQWEALVEEDDYCASAWLSLYEPRPKVEGDLIQRIKDEEDVKTKAFFLAMLSADQSSKAAEALAMRYTDNTPVLGEKYVYKIGIRGLEEVEAHTFVIADRFTPNLAPWTPQVESKEKAVLLSWSTSLDQKAFTSYYLEKAEHENGPYSRLNKTAIVHLDNPNKEGEQLTYFTDSLAQNYKPFYYRLRGIDPFGDVSEPSTTVMGMGKDLTPPPSPEQLTAETLENRYVKLTWKQGNTGDVSGFYVGRAHDFSDDFVPLHQHILSGEQLMFVDSFANPALPNYYMVSVVDTAGNVSFSESAFAFFKDEDVIATPKNLTGKIDTNGIVTLTWSPVEDPTLIGYRIYFSNSPKHSFIMRSGDLLTDTVYTEKITLHTLSERILYKVAAVDIGYGHSFPSEALELKKPDKIPPVPGVFTDVRILENKTYLAWSPGSSKDMVSQEIWREKAGENATRLAVLDKESSTYMDTSLVYESAYTYYLRTQDDDGLYSAFSSPAAVQTNAETLPGISSLRVEWDKETKTVVLHWSQVMAGVHYIVYRADANMAIRAIGNVDNTQYKDIDVDINQQYQYGVRVKNDLGILSDLSELISVQTTMAKQ